MLTFFQLHPQQRLLDRQRPLGRGQQGEHTRLEQHVTHHWPQGCTALLGMQLHGEDHRIDNALAQPCGKRRQYAGDQGGDHQADKQCAGGAPDQKQGASGLVEQGGDAIQGNWHAVLDPA